MTIRAALTGFARGLSLALITTCSVGTALAEPFSQQSVVGSDALVLQGTGTASYLLWDVYDAALYAPAGASRAAIVNAEVPLSLVLEYQRDVSREDIRKATWSVLRKQHATTMREPLRAGIEALQDAMVDVTEGDRYRLEWDPQTPRLSLALNGNIRFVSDDMRLARTYLGIWLAEPPLSTSLREALLSRTD
ncbi:chalcone isomerase family protein [Chromohalobacter israelensis]|uniref:chalcone isomerase family protein n=1 Tax=Chromohalobacter israelensis TaxID=141390 RepID=UPI0015C41A47|nr:chalcone isomerase family protein [Chromohalobacter salexigens]